MPLSTARCLSAASLLLCAATTHALERAPVLSLELAQTMSRTCEVMAKAKGWRMNVAVVDAGTNMIVFHRMDQAFLGSSDMAIRKAKFSASFPFSTRYAGELTFGKDGKPGGIPGLADMPGVVTFAGGLPIMVGTTQVGGIGVSGGSPDEDELCAAAALEAVKDALK